MNILLMILSFWAGAGAPPLAASEVQDTVHKAYEDYLQGRYDQALAGYRYLTVLGITSPDPDSNMAVLSRDAGQQDAALPLWVKASLLEGIDGFIWNQRGWAYLALDRPKEARESFLKAVERSSSTASQAEANLGAGMMALLDSHPKAALTPLRDALVQGPYIIPAAAYQTALTALAIGEKQMALAYFRQSIRLDPLNLEAIKGLARLYQKIGENRSAWRAYHMVLSLDSGDLDAFKNIRKVAQYMPENTGSVLLPVRRLSRPLLNASGRSPLEDPVSSATLRVALYSNSQGKPATALRTYFVSNANFHLLSGNGEVIKEDGKGHDQWEIIFRPENNIVEVRDTAHNIQYTSKQPFRIVPDSRHGSVLIKSAEFTDTLDFDSGDRELRGSIEVIPTPYGFKLVNDLFLEDYLYGVVAATLPPGSPAEAYKAQAVLSRTKALWYKTRPEENLERSDICDSIRCQKYLGLNEEMLDSSKAVAATEGMVLKLNGKLPQVLQHENCGGVTEAAKDSSEKNVDYLASVPDGPTPAGFGHSPVELERWVHEYPPRDRYCEAGSLSPAAQSRWIRVLDAEELRGRAEKIKSIGRPRHVRALRRSPTGRIQTLEVLGTRDSFLRGGDTAIGDFLSPNSLRSTLFTIQPLMNGNIATHFILWGAGTGHGLGLCNAGAIGQASLGRGWQMILSHYFPNLKIESIAPKAKTGGLKNSTAQRKPLNPRKKKAKQHAP